MKIVTAKFTDNRNTDVFGVYQWNYGQVLRIEGLKLPKMVEVHFSLEETGGKAVPRIGTTKDGATDVIIPDSMLENEGVTGTYKIYAWVYLTDADSGSTEYKVTIHVKARSKPEVPGGGDNPDAFHEAVLAVRESAEKAEEAQKQAEGYAHGREDLPERAEDNAKHYSDKASEDAKKTAEDRKEVERLVESVSGIDEQVAKVEKLSKDAQEAATQAGTSAEQAELHKQAAETASSAAQTAARKTEADRTSVENMKTDVENLSTQVQKNKESVDKTAQDFALNAQQALADVNNAGQIQTERVQSVGTTVAENIKTAQNTATQAVETAKVEAVKAVQTEGTKQTGAVTTEGEKQVQAVQTAAQEIIADRERIQKNTTDIAELRQNKADAITETASGTLLNIKDSSGAFFEDFSMTGKTTQDGTPTPDAPVEIVNAGQDGTIEIKVTGKNLIDEKEIYKTDTNYFISDKRYGGKGINLKAGTLYTFSVNKNVDGLYIHSYSDTPKELTKVYGQQKLTYTPENDVKVQLLIYRDKKIIEGTTTQLEEGTVATSYEPYRQPQTITLSLDRPLTKWDRLEKREGVWGIVRQSAQEELTQYNFDTYILPSGSYPTGVYCYATKKSNAVLENQSSFCTHFKNSNYVYLATNAKIGLYSDHDKVQYKYFISDKPTVEDFKAWLAQQKEAGTPVELVYKTAEETWEPLPEEMQSALNALHTNYPTTIISNSENAEMELSYIADTKNYHLGREEILQKQILEIQNALISQKISGGGIKVTNSAKLPIVKLSVFGKSEQITTTGANLFNALTITEKHWLNTENGNIEPASTFWTSDFIEVEEGDYCLTEKGTNRNCGYDEGKNFVKALLASKGKITVTSGIKFIRVSGVYETIKPNNFMINRGSTTKPYEPYTGGKPSPSPEYPQEITSCGENGTINLEITGDNAEPQTLTIPTPNGLLGLKVDVNGNYTDENGQQWICDEIDLARGKYIQRIRKIILDGSEQWYTWGKNANGNIGFYLYPNISDNSNNISYYECICNYLPYSENAYKGKTIGVRILSSESYLLYYIIFSVKQSDLKDVSTNELAIQSLKEFLSTKKAEGKPVEIYCKLSKQKETNLPPETIAAFKKLHTNYPTTIVSNNADAGMELTYTADTQSYIDGKIATLSKAIL